MEKRGFAKLEKYYYLSSKDEIERLQEQNCVIIPSKEELLKKCDYTYRVNSRIVGFNKKGFNKAVNGDEDLYTTISCQDIDFLKNLKHEYGKYVTLVYVYADDSTLRKVAKEYPQNQQRSRMNTGKSLKFTYSDNMTLFDNVILYGGEESVFNLDNLYSQLDIIIEKAKNNEIMLNSQRKVELPYCGTEDYIFISYAHKDYEKVSPIMHIMQRNGFRVWYDSGINGGDNWKKVLREKIRCCKDFIIFTSGNSVISDDVKIEIVTAEIYERKIINVKLDNAEFDGTVENILHNIHAINANSKSFEKKLIGSLDKSTREESDDVDESV